MYTINSEKYNENIISNMQLCYKNKIMILNCDIFKVKQLKSETKKALTHQVNM
jgi:hypothetical protein